MANRRKRSVEKEAYWRRHVERQAESGSSIRRYCGQHGLTEQSFYVWRRRLQNEGQETTGPRVAAERGLTGRGHVRRKVSERSRSAGLVAVDVIDAPRSNAVLEMSVTDGITIRLREDVSVETLERVLRAPDALHSGEPTSNRTGRRQTA